MVFVAAADFNNSSSCCFSKWPQFGEGQSRMVSPSTPVPGHVLGSLISCSPHRSLCEAVVNEYFKIVSPGTTNTEWPSQPPPFCTLPGQGVDWVPFMSLVPVMVPGQGVKTWMVNLPYCFPYWETLQLALIWKEKEGRGMWQDKIEKPGQFTIASNYNSIIIWDNVTF